VRVVGGGGGGGFKDSPMSVLAWSRDTYMKLRKMKVDELLTSLKQWFARGDDRVGDGIPRLMGSQRYRGHYPERPLLGSIGRLVGRLILLFKGVLLIQHDHWGGSLPLCEPHKGVGVIGIESWWTM